MFHLHTEMNFVIYKLNLKQSMRDHKNIFSWLHIHLAVLFTFQATSLVEPKEEKSTIHNEFANNLIVPMTLGKPKYLGFKIPTNTSYCLHSADKYIIALCLERKTEKGNAGKWQDTLISNIIYNMLYCNVAHLQILTLYICLLIWWKSLSEN